MECSRISLLLFLLIFLISVFPRRELAQRVDHFSSPTYIMSPSPSPLPSLGSDSENAPSPTATRPERLSCDDVSNKCEIQNYSTTACVPFLGEGFQASYVVVLNGGESSLQLNLVVLPANVTLEGLAISGHEAKKINFPSNARGDASILLNVGNGECTIHLGAPIPQSFYTSYLTPINATYLIFAAALLVGGSWACCNVVNRRRHSDGGVPYQELQMEQRRGSNSTFVDGGGWNQNWDEEWNDEEKAVVSPCTMRPRKVSTFDYAAPA